MQLLKEEAQKQGLVLTGKMLGEFQTYSDTLISVNENMNLTAVTDSEGVQLRHFYDSLSPLFFNLIDKGSSVIDVGTGAGFPGLPLKIVREDISLTLTDSLNKRLEFLKELTAKIDTETNIVHARAEDLGQDKEYREKYDICVSRAVASLNVLIEYTLPLVKVGGKCIYYKGKTAEEELALAKKAIEMLGGAYKETKSYEISGTTFYLIICEKIKSTPQKYPRKAGIPKKTPLLL